MSTKSEVCRTIKNGAEKTRPRKNLFENHIGKNDTAMPESTEQAYIIATILRFSFTFLFSRNITISPAPAPIQSPEITEAKLIAPLR